MNFKRKLTIAKAAQQFLNQAIAEMETGKDANKFDYDLWHAFRDLKSIQDTEDAEQIPVHVLGPVAPLESFTEFSPKGI